MLLMENIGQTKSKNIFVAEGCLYRHFNLFTFKNKDAYKIDYQFLV